MFHPTLDHVLFMILQVPPDAVLVDLCHEYFICDAMDLFLALFAEYLSQENKQEFLELLNPQHLEHCDILGEMLSTNNLFGDSDIL